MTIAIEIERSTLQQVVYAFHTALASLREEPVDEVSSDDAYETIYELLDEIAEQEE